MPTGANTTSSLSDSLPIVIDSARRVREFDGTFKRTCDWRTLPSGTGINWDEIALSQLTAQGIGETDWLDNPQQIVDTLLSIEPATIGIHVRFTRKALDRISKNVAAQLGPLKQAAIERQKDKDYLSILDTATTSSPGAGNTLTSGVISAFVSEIMSNTTEPAPGGGDIYAVLHGRQVKDIQDEVVAGVGTYTVPTGMTQDVFREGFMGSLFGANVFIDGNITVDGSSDSKGGVHHKQAIIGVQANGQRAYTKELPDFGGGGEDMFMYDEYAYGVRQSVWLYEVYSDTTQNTS